VHLNTAVLRSAEISLDIELITLCVRGDLEQCNTARPEPTKDAGEERIYDGWRIVLEDDDTEHDVNRGESVENLDPRGMHEFDVSQSLLSHMGRRQSYMWKRNVACQDAVESARQPWCYPAGATAEFQARFELRRIHTVAVEPNGETHCILFTTGVEGLGIRGEILPLILLVAAYRPKRFCLTLLRPTTLDSLEKPAHRFLIRFEVHADRRCPIDGTGSGGHAASECGKGARRVSSGTPKLGALNEGTTQGLEIPRTHMGFHQRIVLGITPEDQPVGATTSSLETMIEPPFALQRLRLCRTT